MLKKVSAIAVAGALALTISACGKQEQPKQPQAPTPQSNLALPQKGQEATVTVPPDVKGKWKAIKVTVEDKTANTKKDIELTIGTDTPIPGTSLSIKPIAFMPSFVMQGLNITSASNDTTNPAAQVIISEGGKQIFKGWLFQRFPTTHAFTHPKYAVTLSGWVQS